LNNFNKQIRDFLNSYEDLKSSKKIKKLLAAKNKLSELPLCCNSLSDSFKKPKMICLHQFLFYRLINNDFNIHLVNSVSKQRSLKYPLPIKWTRELKNYGINSNTIVCLTLWFFFQIKWYAIGIFTFIIEILRIFNTKTINGNYSHFINLGPNNLSITKNNSTIISWFLNQEESKSINSITHDVKGSKDFEYQNKKIQRLRNNLPPLKGFFSITKFLFWGFYTIPISILNTKKRLLLREEVLNKVIELTKNKNLPKYYLFHNSNWIFRPLWTYTAEKKNCSIILYHYSTNNFSFHFKNENTIQCGHWNITSWPNHWVWNETQKLFVNEFIKFKTNILIKGFIPFSSKPTKHIKEDLKYDKSILVFDVQPQKKYFMASNLQFPEYYNEINVKKFFEHLQKITRNKKFNIIFKRKRESVYTSKSYLNYLKNLKLENNNWIEVDPDLSAQDVIDFFAPKLCISMPYTSTAIIAKCLNFNSVYYDPTEKIDISHYSNNNIEVIQGYKSLENYINSLD